MAISYRQTLQSNEQRTKIVIALFLSIYCLVGFIIDLSFLHSLTSKPDNPVSFLSLFISLITFKNFPYFTTTMVVIGAVSVWVTFHFNDKISLWGQEYVEVDSSSKDPTEKQLYNIVEELKISANLSYMPKVYLIEADYPNAFASGYSEQSAMVAITRGLFEKLNRAEVQAVMAHEISHIKHMDIKLTLFVGVLSNILLMVVDLFFRPQFFKDSKNGNQILVLVMILRIVLPIITTMLLMFLSRSREYMADAGAVKLTRDPDALASALEKISNDYDNSNYIEKGQYIRQSAYIFPPVQKGFDFWNSLFSTHPPIEERIEILKDKRKRYVNALKLDYDEK